MSYSPEYIKWLYEHGEISHVQHTPNGTIRHCVELIPKDPKELEANIRRVQQVAQRLRAELYAQQS